jgi:hypothetical protein
MELSLPHMLHLFNIFRENDGNENCAQVLEEEVYKMFGIKSLYDEHDCNFVSMNSLNIHDASDMQRHKLGDDLFSPPIFDEQIYYDDSMPPIYDDYIDESGFGRVSTLGNDPTILEGVESFHNIDKSGFGEVITLFSDESTILEEVPIDYENKVAIYDYYCDDMYAIKKNDNHETCHLDFNFQFRAAVRDGPISRITPSRVRRSAGGLAFAPKKE